MTSQINYRAEKQVPAEAVNQLFRNNRLNDWFSVEDTRHYIDTALFIASAWSKQKCIGVIILCGDGRISVEIDTLVVDSSYRRMGVATELLRMAMESIKKLDPYHVKVEVFEKSTEHLYANFGFVKNEGTWLLQHGSTGRRLHAKATRLRSERSEANQRRPAYEGPEVNRKR